MNKVKDPYFLIENRYINLALNRFEWNGLPEGLTGRKIEEYLFTNGMVMFFKHENGGLACLPCYGTQDFNIYNEPISYLVYGLGYQKTINAKDGVVIRNNLTGTGDLPHLQEMIKRLSMTYQTMDLNLNAQKTPYVVLCDEKERLTFKNMLNQVNEFAYAIFGSKSLRKDSIEVLETKADYLLDKLYDHRNNVENEILTFLGINNNNTDKKERLVVDEVNANNDFIALNLDHMFDERERMVKEVNKFFGTNISVKKRGVDNGEIHNRVEKDGESV